MLKRIISILFFCIFATPLFSQVGGVSNSKMIATSTEPVNKYAFEFEPVFGFGYSKKMWDSGKNLLNRYDTDSLAVLSNFDIRFTYGLSDKAEIGVSLPLNISAASWGLKYNVISTENIALAAMAGFNHPLGNMAYSTNKSNAAFTPAIAGGLVFSTTGSEIFSMDFDIQYQRFIRETIDRHSGDLFFNTEAGYFVSEKYQLCAGFSYLASTFEDNINNQRLFTINAGATIEAGDNFTIIIAAPFDVFGQNIEKSAGLVVAITFLVL